MRPIILTKVKRDQFSKELEREWISCKSLEDVSKEMQKIQGNIEEVRVNYWVKKENWMEFSEDELEVDR